jgi:hypothetical protein
VRATFIILNPVEGVLQRDTFYHEAVTVIEKDDLGSVLFTRSNLSPGVGALPFVIMDLSCLDAGEEVGQEAVTAAVDDALALDSDAGLTAGLEQGPGAARTVIQTVGAGEERGV